MYILCTYMLYINDIYECYVCIMNIYLLDMLTQAPRTLSSFNSKYAQINIYIEIFINVMDTQMNTYMPTQDPNVIRTIDAYMILIRSIDRYIRII